MPTDTTRENNNGRLPPAVWWMVEWFWSPGIGWHARRTNGTEEEAPGGAVEDPETTLWNLLAEEVRNDGRPDVDLGEIVLDERVPQRQSKRMYRRYFGRGMIGC
jgi:hypothetical protein